MSAVLLLVDADFATEKKNIVIVLHFKVRLGFQNKRVKPIFCQVLERVGLIYINNKSNT